MTVPLAAQAVLPRTAAAHSVLALLKRGGTALCDQAAFGFANFLLNALLAVSLPPAEFGAFAVAFTMFMIAAGFYNALVLEPAAVLRTSLYDHQPRSYCRAQLLVHAAYTALLGAGLGGVAAVLVTTGLNAPVGWASLGAAAALPFILLLWLARRFLYVLRRPGSSLAGNCLYLSAIVAGMTVLQRSRAASPFTGYLVYAIASCVAAVFMLWRAGAFGPERPTERLELRQLLRDRWLYGKWLLAAVCIESTIVPGLMWLITAMLGLGAVGILRAMQLFAMPFAHAVGVLSSLALPALAKEFDGGSVVQARRKAAVVFGTVAVGALMFETALATFHRPLEALVYGGKFAEYSFLIPILGAATLLDGSSALYAMLISAVRRPHLHLVSVALTAPFALLTGTLLIRWGGLEGAAVTFLLVGAASTAIRRWLARRSFPTQELPPAARPAPKVPNTESC